MPRRDGRKKLNRSLGRARKHAAKRKTRKPAPLQRFERHGTHKRGGGMG